MDDTPILPAIDGKKVKTFDELVEYALQRDDSPANLGMEDTEKPKKPFLRKGSGLVRFAPKPDTPKRERRHCCRKKLEQQFMDEAEKVNCLNEKHCSKKSDQTKSNNNIRNDNNRKKVTIKPAPQVNNNSKRYVSELNGVSIQPKKIQTNGIINKRPTSGKRQSNPIISRYSNEIEPIQREQSNHIISHEFLSKVCIELLSSLSTINC